MPRNNDLSLEIALGKGVLTTTARLEIALWSVVALFVVAVLAVLPAVLAHLGLLHHIP